MSAPNSKPRREEGTPPQALEGPEPVNDDDEVTDVMDRKDLPDFGVEETNDAPRTPRNRPSTFTRLLLDKRQK